MCMGGRGQAVNRHRASLQELIGPSFITTQQREDKAVGRVSWERGRQRVEPIDGTEQI